jgi:CRISPR/Cas system-associated protein Cas10 (large subunit of type III CRISPR-Cas system)
MRKYYKKLVDFREKKYLNSIALFNFVYFFIIKERISFFFSLIFNVDQVSIPKILETIQ